MRIEFDDAKHGPVPWSETLEVETDSLGSPDIVDLGPIETNGALSFAEPNYRLRGALRYQRTLSCYRCLGEISGDVDGDFEYSIERRRPPRDEEDDGGSDEDGSSGKPGGEIELVQADLEVVIVESDHLDSGFFVREQILLQVPMKPLCRPECKGLCGQCGTDLNVSACVCKSSAADPRWAGLESIKSQLEE